MLIGSALAALQVGSPHKGLDSLRDLVVSPGDFVIQGAVGGSFVSPEDAGVVLGQLKASMGVFAVLGNHDWWPDAKRVQSVISQNNITMLENASQKIIAGDCELC